jgi:hypothetical protein
LTTIHLFIAGPAELAAVCLGHVSCY